MAELSPVSAAIIDFYRGWQTFDATEKKRGGGYSKFPIIDMDFAPRDGEPHTKNSPAMASLDEVQDRAETLLSNLPESEPDTLFLRRKLEASRMLVEAMRGKTFDFATYVKTLTGVEGRPLPNDTIEAQRETVETLLAERRIEHSPGGHKKFQETLVLRDPAQIRPIFEEELRNVLRISKQYIVCRALDVNIEYPSVKATWAGYFTTDAFGNFKLLVNTNTERFPHTMGGLARLGAHEIGGHALQASIWRAGISAGRVDPALGITTIHDPEVTHLEAVAQMAEELFVPTGSWDYSFATRYQRYRFMVYHNAHYAINTGEREKDVIAYTAKHLPFEPLANIEGSIQDRRDDPIFRAYGMCYAPAYQLVSPLLEMPPERQKQLMPRLYERPLLPEQISDLVSSVQHD